MTVLAHRLRHRVEIQTPTVSRDSNGDIVRAWSTFAASVPAEILEGAGKESSSGGQPVSDIAARVTIRYRAGVVHGMRILHADRVYHIQSSYRDAKLAAWQTLICTDGALDE